MDYRDYYRILEVPKDATPEAIKKSYRRLARKYHPDFNKGNRDAENKFKEINEAYQVLGDADKRRKYDQLGSDWERYRNTGPAGPGFGGYQNVRFETGRNPFAGADSRNAGFSDFFRTFFGGFDFFGNPEEATEEPVHAKRASGRGASPRQADLSTPITISLREAITGTSKRVTLNRQMTCPQCRGSGMVGKSICPRCFGRATIQQPEDIEVRIPAGVRNGSNVRIRGKGNPTGTGPTRGNLYLEISIAPDDFFRLENRDLKCEVPVSMYDALQGAEITVPTADGKVRMRIPPETQNGQTFRLKGKGLPAVGQIQPGDQIVTIKVLLPQNLTAQERELIEQLAALRRIPR